MFNSLTNAVAAAAFVMVGAAGATTATTSAASAGSLHYGITIGGSNSVLRIGSHRHGRRSHGRRGDYRRGRCTVRHAIRKARRLGVHHTHLARANHRRIVVRGRRHGYRARIVFANRRHCPVIRYRR